MREMHIHGQHTESEPNIYSIYCLQPGRGIPPRIAKPDLNQPPSAISNKSLALFLTSVHRTVETNEV